MSNEWEERARAVKAYKIARVLSLASVSPDEWRAADEPLRYRVAELAHVLPPSEQTWEEAIAVLTAMLEAS